MEQYFPFACISWTPVFHQNTQETQNVSHSTGDFIQQILKHKEEQRNQRERQSLGEDLQFPGPAAGAVGGKVLLAPLNPPSQFITVSWRFGVKPVITGFPDADPIPEPDYKDRVSFNNITLALELRNLILADSGTYDLTVVTTAETVAGHASLEVFESISGTSLNGPGDLLIEGESSANITSEGTGTITSVQWMKDNSPLSPSNSITISSDNRSVLIDPVRRSDSGVYQCTLSNPVSSKTANLTLTVNYGPEDVVIKGPSEVGLGYNVSLSCSANSIPPASFSWKFNGSDTDVTTDIFPIDMTDFTHSGIYTCTAWNSVTKKNEIQTHALVIKEGAGDGGGGDEEGGGLSTGTIVGIVIGVLAAVAAVCGLTIYFTKTKKIPKPNQKEQSAGPEPRNPNEPNMWDLRINHRVSRKPRAPPPPSFPPPPPPPNGAHEQLQIIYINVQQIK